MSDIVDIDDGARSQIKRSDLASLIQVRWQVVWIYVDQLRRRHDGDPGVRDLCDVGPVLVGEKRNPFHPASLEQGGLLIETAGNRVDGGIEEHTATNGSTLVGGVGEALLKDGHGALRV